MENIYQPAQPGRQPARDDFERRYGVFGGREIRGGFAIESDIPLTDIEVRDSGAGSGQFTIVGHAAVFRKWSLDLGGFRERILPGFFDEVLQEDPDIFHLWDHNSRYVLSRTRSKSLELTTTPQGLRMWSRVAPTSYAADLRVLMDRGDIDQASFAFDVAKDEWRIKENEDGNEIVERDLIQAAALYDVTTTAMGAYPQTDSQVARQKALDYAVKNGRLPEGAAGVALVDLAGTSESREDTGSRHVQLELARRKARMRRERTPSP